jgi:hypothetical protein
LQKFQNTRRDEQLNSKLGHKSCRILVVTNMALTLWNYGVWI